MVNIFMVSRIIPLAQDSHTGGTGQQTVSLTAYGLTNEKCFCCFYQTVNFSFFALMNGNILDNRNLESSQLSPLSKLMRTT